jgi:S1-C subfamily serine protease
MFLWAAETLAFSRAQNVAVENLYQRLRPSLAILGDPRQPTGTAALVDSAQGLFLAHNDAVRGDTVQARLGDGSVRLRVVARDPRTNLVLLSYKTAGGLPGMTPLIVADSEPALGSRVMVLLAQGGLMGSFVGGQKFSLVGERKQVVPVSELRFESPPQLVGGALLVSFDGKILGTMAATLVRPGNSADVSLKTLTEVQKAVQVEQTPSFGAFASKKIPYGPAGLTVAYSPNISLVRRVVEGFLSPDHRPEYAALGIQIADAAGGGAVIRRIVPNTPASRVPVQVGDILLSMSDRPIMKQYDFVQALLSFRPGDRITLRIRHDGVEKSIDVTLARVK